MSLFSISEINKNNTADEINKSASLEFPYKGSFVNGRSKKELEISINQLKKGFCKFFRTDGAWSNIEILEYLLKQTGEANVYLCTWSISEEAIRRFNVWKETGQIKNLYTIIDNGLRNRKPEIYQSAVAMFENLKFTALHAKITIIENDTHKITLLTSANYTRNPRTEVGIIIWDDELANENIKWIKEAINAN